MSSQTVNGQPGNYNVTPATRNDGDPSAFEFDSKGNLLVNLAVGLSLLLSGSENDTVGVAPFRRTDAYNTVPTDTTANTVQVIKAAVTNKTIYVTDITISTDGGAACNVIVQDDAGSPIAIEKVYFPATADHVNFHYQTPKAITAGQALKYICSSATPHITVSAAGYAI